MYRHVSIASVIFVVAFELAALGCSSASSPSLDSSSRMAGSHAAPHSEGSWSRKAPMFRKRSSAGAATVNGILYAIGGEGGGPYAVGGFNGTTLNTVEAYDPVTDSWTSKAPLPTARFSLAAGVIGDRVYAVGGDNGSGSLNAVEAYDPATNSWTTKAPMPTARERLDAGVVRRKLYAFGGIILFHDNMKRVEAFAP